ncbi:MAG TPA: ATP12 family protein [Alphaproteobacteria bacterium]|jgi:chaperone required for assembly of F1-ATPase
MKKFYKTVAVEPRAGGFAVLLDGKPIRTPAGKPLLAPTAALAHRIAAEWSGQGERVRPGAMPFTQLLNTALDRVGEGKVREAVVTEIAGYAATDLVCFRAAHPPALAERQRAAWQPLLDWLAERYGAALAVTETLAAPSHAPAALSRIAAAVAEQDALRLAALQLAIGALGSVVIALALAEGHIDAEAAFRAAHLDDLHQMQEWGEDAEAMARLERIRADIAAAADFMRLARGA